jgi:hypothetical protein
MIESPRWDLNNEMNRKYDQDETGWSSGSMGLVADSLDMLADALDYGLGLIAFDGIIAKKKSIRIFSTI